jgi:exonuclease VII small subunit
MIDKQLQDKQDAVQDLIDKLNGGDISEDDADELLEEGKELLDAARELLDTGEGTVEIID